MLGCFQGVRLQNFARFSLIGLLLLVGVTGLSQQSTPLVSTVNISVNTSSPGGISISFNPNSVTVNTGSKVIWLNQSTNQVILRSTQLGFQVNLAPQGNFSYLFQTAGSYQVTALVGSANAIMTVNVSSAETTQPSPQQPAQTQPQLPPAPTQGGVQEIALIHDFFTGKIYPATIAVRVGITVRLYNTAINGFQSHATISRDQDGHSSVFGVQSFEVASGVVRTVEFTPDQVGTYYISERPFGNDIVGKLIVTTGS